MDPDLASTNFSQENYREIQTLSLKPGGLSLCPEFVPPRFAAAYGHSAWRGCSGFSGKNLLLISMQTWSTKVLWLDVVGHAILIFGAWGLVPVSRACAPQVHSGYGNSAWRGCSGFSGKNLLLISMQTWSTKVLWLDVVGHAALSGLACPAGGIA